MVACLRVDVRAHVGKGVSITIVPEANKFRPLTSARSDKNPPYGVKMGVIAFALVRWVC
jgi:hypothetical protein